MFKIGSVNLNMKDYLGIKNNISKNIRKYTQLNNIDIPAYKVIKNNLKVKPSVIEQETVDIVSKFPPFAYLQRGLREPNCNYNNICVQDLSEYASNKNFFNYKTTLNRLA